MPQGGAAKKLEPQATTGYSGDFKSDKNDLRKNLSNTQDSLDTVLNHTQSISTGLDELEDATRGRAKYKIQDISENFKSGRYQIQDIQDKISTLIQKIDEAEDSNQITRLKDQFEELTEGLRYAKDKLDLSENSDFQYLRNNTEDINTYDPWLDYDEALAKLASRNEESINELDSANNQISQQSDNNLFKNQPTEQSSLNTASENPEPPSTPKAPLTKSAKTAALPESDRNKQRQAFKHPAAASSISPDTSAIDKGWSTPANNNGSTTPTLRGMPQGAAGTKTLRGQPQTSPGAKTLRGIGPSAPKTAPRPTGTGSASPVGKKSPKNPSRSVGPKAITRPVNPMQLASRLQSDQQRARLDSAPGTGPTREEMLAGTGAGDNAILPGQFDPLKGQSAFGREAEAPGSMSEASDRTDDAKGGGPVMSDLERQRAMQFSQAQMAAAAGASGVAGAGQTGTETAAPGAITAGKKSAVAQTSPQEQTIEETEQTIEEQVPADQKQPGKKGSDLQTAQNIASAMNMEKTAKVLGAAQAVKGNIEAVRKVQKTAQAFWNIIKAGELAAGVSILSLVILIITANIQMINKYTFKNRIIPPTFLIEDAAIICVNCALCGASCISVTAMPFIMIPLIGSLILMAGLLGLDFLDIFDLGIM